MTDAALPADAPFPADGFALFPDRSVIALRVNGELKDLATRVEATDAVEPVTDLVHRRRVRGSDRERRLHGPRSIGKQCDGLWLAARCEI